MDWQIISSWTSIVAIIVTALAVAATKRRPVFRYYALFSLAIAIWLGCQYFVDNNIDTKLWLGIGFLAIEMAVGFFVLFAYTFPDRTTLRHRYTWLPFLGLILLGPFSFSSLTVSVGSNDTLHFGAIYILQIVALIGTVGAAVSVLALRYSKISKGEQSQLRTLLLAFIPFILASYLTGVTFVDNNNIQFLRPVSALLMIGMIIYAIVRRKLFDIRAVVARTLGYGLSLVVLAALYGFVVFGIAGFVFHLHISATAQIFLSGATGLASLLFARLKNSFDRLTNRLFYQDAYDPQILLDGLNQTLVSTFDLEKLSMKVASLISVNIKTQYCLMVLKEIGSHDQRIIGTDYQLAVRDAAKLRKLVAKHKNSIIVADELIEQSNNQELRELMLKNDASVLMRLVPTAHGDEEIGFIVLGRKRSGNPYTTQDIRVLDIIGKELSIAIQNALHFEEIQNFNLTLQQKVVEATNKLRRTNEKLKALDETKDDFISMASHQLRTPLTSVKGYVSLVLDGDAGPIKPAQRKLLEQSFASSQRMVYLISDLLNVSRLRTGKFVIESAPVNLASMITDEIQQLKQTAASKSLTITYDKPEHFPTLMLDETKTRQVLMNFMDNAIYYTPQNGNIEIKLIDKPTTVEMRVIDDGIGVPRSEQHHLFTKFYRAGNARKARPDGTGLGLFMAKKVIVAEGGALIFESEENKGSTFGFTFSKSKLAVPTGAKAK